MIAQGYIDRKVRSLTSGDIPLWGIGKVGVMALGTTPTHSYEMPAAVGRLLRRG